MRSRLWRLALVAMAGAAGCGDSPTSPNEEPIPGGGHQVDFRVTSGGATLAAGLLLPSSEGPHPVVIMVRGSDRWTRLGFDGFTANFLDRGIAVWSYDRRGVGESTGTYDNDVNDFPVYADDVAANIRAARERAEIDRARIGVYGFSQGGWIVPLALQQSPEVAFTFIASGPAVSTGEETLFSELTGDDACARSPLSLEEIERQLEQAVPSGYDPRPVLAAMPGPVLWQYCSNDTSVPTARSVAVLKEIRDSAGRDFTVDVFPGCNHNFVDGGRPCQMEGPRVDWVTPMFAWLEPILAR